MTQPAPLSQASPQALPSALPQALPNALPWDLPLTIEGQQPPAELPANRKAPAPQNQPPAFVLAAAAPTQVLFAAVNAAPFALQGNPNPPQTTPASAGSNTVAAGQGIPPAIPLPPIPVDTEPQDGTLGNSANRQPNTSGSAPGTSATGSPQAATANELAFAAKIQPAQAASQSALSAEMSTASAVSAVKKAAGTEGASDGSPSSSNLLPQTAIAAFGRNAELASAPPSHPSAEPVRAADVQGAQVESAPKTTAPLKDISLQVTQPGAEKVDVRVTQQAGEVRVAVRTGDVDLAHGLRQGLSDLAGRLEENGYRAETWRPSGSMTPIGNAEEAHNTSGNSRNMDPQGQPGWPQQDGGRRNQNQSNQPRWVEEMESTLAGGDENSGDTYGFGR